MINYVFGIQINNHQHRRSKKNMFVIFSSFFKDILGCFCKTKNLFFIILFAVNNKNHKA